MLAITDVSNCQQKFCFLYYLFASSKVVKVFPILCYNTMVKLILVVKTALYLKVV